MSSINSKKIKFFFYIIITGTEYNTLLQFNVHYDYGYELNGKTHKNSWGKFSQDYLVNGKEVEWDYFPR